MKPKQTVLNLYKNRGETPLECIKRFKSENSEYKNEPMTYAGRLDPLAEGLLLVLVGEECKNKEKYLGFDKEYEVDVLFGFSTDTYDILGKVIHIIMSDLFPIKNIKDILITFIGKFSQKYPAYSSKTINGETLFSLAKSGELNENDIPEKEVEIKEIKLLKHKELSKKELEKYIIKSVNSVSGDFRQEEILKKWEDMLLKTKVKKFPVISIKVNCTSGTYMRSLANSIGEKIGVPALALNIKRTRVGEYKI